MTPLHTLILIFICSIFGLIGYLVGRPKGHPGLGFWLAFFLSLLGNLAVALMPASEEARIRQTTERMRAEEKAHRRLDAERGLNGASDP
jgi:hypothetical protein